MMKAEGYTFLHNTSIYGLSGPFKLNYYCSTILMQYILDNLNHHNGETSDTLSSNVIIHSLYILLVGSNKV